MQSLSDTMGSKRNSGLFCFLPSDNFLNFVSYFRPPRQRQCSTGAILHIPLEIRLFIKTCINIIILGMQGNTRTSRKSLIIGQGVHSQSVSSAAFLRVNLFSRRNLQQLYYNIIYFMLAVLVI